MTTKSVLIQLSGSDLETLIFDCVDRAIKLNNSTTSTAACNKIGGIGLAEKITGLSKPRIYTLVSERKIPHKKRGNRLYFVESELSDWVMQGNREQKEEVFA